MKQLFKILVMIAITITLQSCDLGLAEGDKDWGWAVNIEDESGKDIFFGYEQYYMDSLRWRIRGLESDPLSPKFEIPITADSASNTVFFSYELSTHQTQFLSDGTQFSSVDDQKIYYLYYGNGDIDTLLATVEGPGKSRWLDEGFVNIDVIRYFFNGELQHEFDLKNNPGLEEKIKSGHNDIHYITFVKRTFGDSTNTAE